MATTQAVSSEARDSMRMWLAEQDALAGPGEVLDINGDAPLSASDLRYGTAVIIKADFLKAELRF